MDEYNDNAVHAMVAKLAEYEDAESDGRLITLPCKAGETVYYVDGPDCKSGECPDVDRDGCKYSGFHSPTKEVEACRAAHAMVIELAVDSISASVWDEELFGDGNPVVFTINDFLEIEPEEIYRTYEAAEAALNSEDQS
jgi:hypothetical protein